LGKNKLANQKGFTLLEVLIAIAIMALALGSILAIEGGSINHSVESKQMNIVAMLAKNEMITTELDIEGKSFDEVEKETSGKFDPPFEDFGWKREVSEIKFPNLNPGGGGGSKNEGEDQASEMLSKLLSNYLSKALREVKVSVLWMKNGKPQSFSVSTYWVDLNHEFNLSE
jgi:general secretion pathway protein I